MRSCRLPSPLDRLVSAGPGQGEQAGDELDLRSPLGSAALAMGGSATEGGHFDHEAGVLAGTAEVR
jgi:hypothetical protein